MITGHGDYHPAAGRSLIAVASTRRRPAIVHPGRRGVLGARLQRLPLVRPETGTNVWNTALLIGWDEPGGTYDHVAPGAGRSARPAAPDGEFGFTFDRSGYRVPAIMVSPWVEPGSVYNEEYRHTSLIATLRKTWDLGPAFTQRDAQARTFDHVFTRQTPRNPDSWVAVEPNPSPTGRWTTTSSARRSASSAKPADRPRREGRSHRSEPPAALDDPSTEITGELIIEVLRDVAWHFFPQLAPAVASDNP